MNDFSLKHISIRIPLKYTRIIEDSGENLSEFMRKVLEDFFSEEKLKKQIEEYENEITRLKKLLDKVKTDFDTIEEEEREWLIETIQALKKDSSFINPRFYTWVNEFSKRRFCTINQFQEILEKVRKEVFE